MSNLVSDGWKKVTLNQVVDRIRTVVNGEPENVLTISSTGGWVDQRQKWARDMAGESLKKYTHLEAGELSYNRGNSKTYPYGCVFKLKNWTSAAVPNVYHSFRSKEDMIDASFIEYAFHSGVFDKQLSQIITSSARANGLLNITAKDFFDLELLVPSLPEQKKIAAILTSVDNVIEKTQAQIDKLKDLKTGMMQELLTRGVGVDGKPHTEFKDSPVGRIPKAWEVVKLSSVLSKIDSGWSPACIEMPPATGEWGVVKVSAVTRGRFLEKESKTLPKELKPKSHIQIKRGDILLTRANGVADLVGKCVMVSSEPKAKLMMSDKILRLNANDKVYSKFLLHYFNSRQIRKQIELSWGGSSGQKNISQADIKGYFIALPSLNEQMIIGDSISQIDTLLSVREAKLRKLEDSKKALMQDLLTGKVRVKVED